MAQPLPLVGNVNLTAPNLNDNPQSGSPTTPATARSFLANTSIALSNNTLAHVCDITGPMKYSIAWLSLQVKQLVETIRNTIEGLWSSTSGSPFGDEIRTTLKAIKNKVNQIQSLITKAKEVQSAIQQFVSEAQALISFIATLPARVAVFLKDCLSNVTASLKDAIGNAQSIVTDSAQSSLTSATSSLNSASTATPASSASTPASKP
jgi:hypothetical protein